MSNANGFISWRTQIPQLKSMSSLADNEINVGIFAGCALVSFIGRPRRRISALAAQRTESNDSNTVLANIMLTSDDIAESLR